MLRILRSNQPIATALIPLLAVFLWSIDWVSGREPLQQGESLAWLPAVFEPLFPSVLHYLMIASSGLLLNALFNRHELAERRNNLAGWMFVLFAGTLPVMKPLSPALLGSLPFIAGLNAALKVYRQNDGGAHYFNAGFWIGVATLCSQMYAAAGIALIAAVFYTRAANWREVSLPLLGYGLPSAILATLLWLTDQPVFDIVYLKNAETSEVNTLFFVASGVVLVLVLIGFASMTVLRGSSSNKSKNSKAVLLLFTISFALTGGWTLSSEPESLPVLGTLICGWMLPWPLLRGKGWVVSLYFMATLIVAALLFISTY